jgi:hypothetical protein
MKLTIATLTAATLLAGAASALTEPAFQDARDAALGGGGGQNVTGTIAEVPSDAYLDERTQAQSATETVEVTVFAQDAPASVQIDAER